MNVILVSLLLIVASRTALAQVEDPDPDAPKITITKDVQTDDIIVTVEASEAKPTEVFMDLQGEGFLFYFRFYATNTFKIYPTIRRLPTVLIKAEKGQVVPGDLPINVEPVINP